MSKLRKIISVITRRKIKVPFEDFSGNISDFNCSIKVKETTVSTTIQYLKAKNKKLKGQTVYIAHDYIRNSFEVEYSKNFSKPLKHTSRVPIHICVADLGSGFFPILGSFEHTIQLKSFLCAHRDISVFKGVSPKGEDVEISFFKVEEECSELKNNGGVQNFSNLLNKHVFPGVQLFKQFSSYYQKVILSANKETKCKKFSTIHGFGAVLTDNGFLLFEIRPLKEKEAYIVQEPKKSREKRKIQKVKAEKLEVKPELPVHRYDLDFEALHFRLGDKQDTVFSVTKKAYEDKDSIICEIKFTQSDRKGFIRLIKQEKYHNNSDYEIHEKFQEACFLGDELVEKYNYYYPKALKKNEQAKSKKDKIDIDHFGYVSSQEYGVLLFEVLHGFSEKIYRGKSRKIPKQFKRLQKILKGINQEISLPINIYEADLAQAKFNLYGQSEGWYEIDRALNSGTESIVYSIKTSSNKKYILRLIKPNHDDEEEKKYDTYYDELKANSFTKNQLKEQIVSYYKLSSFQKNCALNCKSIVDIHDFGIAFSKEGYLMFEIQEMMDGDLGLIAEKSFHLFDDLQKYELIKKLSQDILSAYNVIHSFGQVYFDTKKANILFKDEGKGNYKFYLTDFGAVKTPKEFEDGQTSGAENTAIGTLQYFSPEIFQAVMQEKYELISEKTDIFSFGLIILEIILERPVLNLYSTFSEKAKLKKYANEKISKSNIKDYIKCFHYKNEIKEEDNAFEKVSSYLQDLLLLLYTGKNVGQKFIEKSMKEIVKNKKYFKDKKFKKYLLKMLAYAPKDRLSANELLLKLKDL